ncbi:hypothetical protein CJ198_11655 [Brevibacterium luteolum]|uniref:Uncharacterized protein n=1 Tax=Brevibacterium luteolum TaxID=199591 RepID=A0A2N6PFH7_9MICO|nr:hypothetical protein CJ198_11655 [Brevibacterium luteolum]
MTNSTHASLTSLRHFFIPLFIIFQHSAVEVLKRVLRIPTWIHGYSTVRLPKANQQVISRVRCILFIRSEIQLGFVRGFSQLRAWPRIGGG